eukprot:gb/GECH01002577.1/.p1 GENE.gb/GECH01002577.1/~~gb/GECH01002577.1/.p1  ORF type:complete len:160 (+),score=22.77 gb/GECH01002577.1/:1-480(+)
MLTSYTWSTDAKRMGSLTHEQRAEQSIQDLIHIYQRYPNIQKEIADNADINNSASIYWSAERSALGAFSFYGPNFGQFRRMYRDAVHPEDNWNIHFCGEHLSNLHPWIEGALCSAFRVLLEIDVSEHGQLLVAKKLDEWDVEGKKSKYLNSNPPELWRY